MSPLERSSSRKDEINYEEPLKLDTKVSFGGEILYPVKFI